MKKIIALFSIVFLTQVSAEVSKILPQGFKPFVEKYCTECHGSKKQKGKLRLDTLSLNFSDAKNLETWSDISESLELLDMPPEDETQPTAKERNLIVHAIRDTLKNAHGKGALTGGHRVPRQLTRAQLENTLRDLLQIDMTIDQSKISYPSPAVSGEFDTNADELKFSDDQLSAWLEICKKFLAKATYPGMDKPERKIVNVPMDKRAMPKYVSLDTMTAGDDFLQLLSGREYVLNKNRDTKNIFKFERETEFVLRFKVNADNSYKKMPAGVKKLYTDKKNKTKESAPVLGIYIVSGMSKKTTKLIQVARIKLPANKTVEVEERFTLPKGYNVILKYDSAPSKMKIDWLLEATGFKELYFKSAKQIIEWNKVKKYKGPSIEGKSEKQIEKMVEGLHKRVLDHVH